MMRPDTQAKNGDDYARTGNKLITKNRLPGKNRNNLRKNREGWQGQDINFGMTKKSKQMLIKDWIPTTIRVKKNCIEISIKK